MLFFHLCWCSYILSLFIDGGSWLVNGQQLVLSQFVVSVDYTTKQWYEDQDIPHHEWRESVTPLLPFQQDWDGYLVYLHTACPSSISASNFASINNRTSFPEQMTEDEGLLQMLPRVGLISRGDDCSWSIKVEHAKSIAQSFNMTLQGIILFDNQTNPPPPIASLSLNENDLMPELVGIPVVFVNQTTGQALLSSVYYAASPTSTNARQQNMATLSRALVFHEQMPDGGAEDGGANRREEEEKDQWIFVAQWVINVIAAMLIIALVAYVCQRVKLRQQQQTERLPVTRESTLSVVDSTSSSFLTIMRRRHGSLTGEQPNEGVGLSAEELEQHYPRMIYDPLLIRNATCAICLDDFLTHGSSEKQLAKLVRRLGCGHGFCAHYPWLGKKSRCCPLCKHDCTYEPPSSESSLMFPLPTVHSSRVQPQRRGSTPTSFHTNMIHPSTESMQSETDARCARSASCPTSPA
ncbi:hypothetical protein BCR43DRAFT_517938 [Syncephalastrum racemosum]|uniref:RING-type domain-containing protein n=1 Tax=Syncephalastrum racemosum TaxID=13706 RepID=A0A1X2H299_SYNRA|nr:hypothetical protein BCR43DRAFT_517938 [Syncephalastrum racemosum]